MKGGVTRYPKDWWVEGVAPDRTSPKTRTLAGAAKSTAGDGELTEGAASTPGCSAYDLMWNQSRGLLGDCVEDSDLTSTGEPNPPWGRP